MYDYRISQFNIKNLKKKFKNYDLYNKSFFYEFDWIETSMQIRPNNKNFFTVEIFDSDKLLILFFFEIKKFFNLKVLTWLFTEEINYTSPIIIDYSIIDKHRLKKTMNKVYKYFNLDLVFLDKNPEYIDNFNNPIINSEAKFSEKISIINMKNLLWPEYFENILNNKTKQTDRRKEKKLKKLGNIEILITTENNEKKEIMNATLKDKISFLNQKKLKTENFRTFYSNLFKKIQFNKKYVCSALKIDGQIIATIIGRINNNSYYYLIPSYLNGDYQKLSPGRILLKEQIKWCFANELEIFDFGPGYFDYKESWSNAHLNYFKIIEAVSFLGIILKNIYILKKFFNKFL